MDSNPEVKKIEIEGLNQDEVVRKAEETATKLGYKHFSVKNIVKIVYSVELYEPIADEATPEQPAQ